MDSSSCGQLIENRYYEYEMLHIEMLKNLTLNILGNRARATILNAHSVSLTPTAGVQFLEEPKVARGTLAQILAHLTAGNLEAL